MLCQVFPQEHVMSYPDATPEIVSMLPPANFGYGNALAAVDYVQEVFIHDKVYGQ